MLSVLLSSERDCSISNADHGYVSQAAETNSCISNLRFLKFCAIKVLITVNQVLRNERNQIFFERNQVTGHSDYRVCVKRNLTISVLSITSKSKRARLSRFPYPAHAVFHGPERRCN